MILLSLHAMYPSRISIGDRSNTTVQTVLMFGIAHAVCLTGCDSNPANVGTADH